MCAHILYARHQDVVRASGSSPQEDILNYPLLSFVNTTYESLRGMCHDIFFVYKDIFVKYLCISYCFMQYPVIFSYLYIETSRFFYIQIYPA